MKLNSNLQAIFRLAFQHDPQEAEYQATKLLLSLPQEILHTGCCRRSQEYENDEPDSVIDNYERQDLQKVISDLRTEMAFSVQKG